ncbi:MAG: TetR family transcriptional regulator [Clostridiales bacterium]|nr:TetR family transcriptional regulator [Clostridiales bacterium]MCC8100406.1 TetR family transcriptional regulator [Clostridiales bacterium]
MPIDTREQIANAVRTLLVEKHVKRLTVKDIVEECSITRQTFYYHFEDIPDLLRWIIERESEKVMEECIAQGDAERGLRYLFLVAVNLRAVVQQSLKTNYGEELERIMAQQFRACFGQIVDALGLYRQCSRADQALIIRYHSAAMMGLLRDWRSADTENLEHIVHQVYLILTGEVSALD